ncbi:MAG: hypothetical protein KGI54_13125 [Pseudomonadota bacterium]|nr:hypothetical protein [Pseudomonadota bacterium]
MANEVSDLTPTPAEVKDLLEKIVNNSTRRADRAHAMNEIIRLQPAFAAGKWSSK